MSVPTSAPDFVLAKPIVESLFTIVLITGSEGPKRPNYSAFHKITGETINLLFVDLNPIEIQTGDHLELIQKKLDDAVRLLVSNSSLMDKLHSLGVDLSRCYVAIDDVGLNLFGREDDSSEEFEMPFPGLLIKWAVKRNAFKNKLWKLAEAAGSNQARYICCVAFAPLQGGKPTFIQKDVLVEICKPVGDGLIDNQVLLDGVLVKSLSDEEKFLKGPRGLTFQELITHFV